MNFVKTIMMCVLLTPTLCWGGKFDGLLGVLSHARTPLVRMSQAGATRGVDMLQNRQVHGAAVLLKAASPKARSMKRLNAERQQQTLLAVEAEKISFMSRQKNQLEPCSVDDNAARPSRILTDRTQESTDSQMDQLLRENAKLETEVDLFLEQKKNEELRRLVDKINGKSPDFENSMIVFGVMVVPTLIAFFVFS